MYKLLTILCIGLCFFLLMQCSDTGTPPEELEFVFPDSNISFIEHVQPMFEAKCGIESGCHSPGNTEIRFTYAELVSRIGVINHRLPSGEVLVDLALHQKNPELAPLYLILLEGYPSPDDRMPPLGRTPLNDNQLNGIRQWIKEGAPE